MRSMSHTGLGRYLSKDRSNFFLVAVDALRSVTDSLTGAGICLATCHPPDAMPTRISNSKPERITSSASLRHASGNRDSESVTTRFMTSTEMCRRALQSVWPSSPAQGGDCHPYVRPEIRMPQETAHCPAGARSSFPYRDDCGRGDIR